MCITQFKKDTKDFSLTPLKILVIFLIWGIGSCEQTASPYLYPAAVSGEVQRVCQIALNWGRRKFSVIDGRVRIMEPRAVPSVVLERPLPDGIYRCGRGDLEVLPCPDKVEAQNPEGCTYQ